MNQGLKENILRVLDSIRPFLQSDSGDVEFIDLTEDLIVKVKLTGACGFCPLSQITLRAGIERSLLLKIPEIKRIEAVI